jgi:membrane dipeptidase
MRFGRRSFLAAGAAAILAAPAVSRPLPKRTGWYADAIIVDGLGGISDPYAPEDQLRLSERAWAEMRMTGITAVRDTLLPVGNHVDGWDQFKENMGHYRQLLLANPDRLKLIEKSSDISSCKREGKLGIILGTQDTAMVGPGLERMGQVKKGGVRCIQLTYNLANLSGDGSIEPRNAGLTNLGRETIRRIEAEKLLLDLSHGGARTIDEAVAFAKRPLTISHTGARAITDHPSQYRGRDDQGCCRKGWRHWHLLHALPCC